MNCNIKIINEEPKVTKRTLEIEFECREWAEMTIKDLKGFKIGCSNSSTNDLLRGIIKAFE